VATADSRTAGREAVVKRQPELIILDVMMDEPDDGFVLAQELRRTGVETPILMLTSISKVTGKEYGRDSEFVPVNEFFTKPISRDSLIAAVERLLKQR
jgi:DNA-binding response OmpR family regulator